MKMLTGESVLLESDPKGLTLTTHRVRQQVKGSGNSRVTSILLDQVTSCGMTRKSKSWLLVFAVLVFETAVLVAVDSFDSEVYLIGGLIVAGIFVLAYFANRRQVLYIHSAEGSIIQPAIGMSETSVLDFVDQLESAKNQRYFGQR